MGAAATGLSTTLTRGICTCSGSISGCRVSARQQAAAASHSDPRTQCPEHRARPARRLALDCKALGAARLRHGAATVGRCSRTGFTAITSQQAQGLEVWLQGSVEAVRLTQFSSAAQGVPFVFLTTVILAAGASILRWLGDSVDTRGLGDGLTLLIALNIASSKHPPSNSCC